MSIAEIIGLVVGVSTLVGFALKLGAQAGRIEKAISTIEPKLAALDKIPALERSVGILEGALPKLTSDISRLREANGEFRGRLDSITEDT